MSFPHPGHHEIPFVSLVLDTLIGKIQNLKVVLTSISVVAKDGGHFFNCFLTISFPSV